MGAHIVIKEIKHLNYNKEVQMKKSCIRRVYTHGHATKVMQEHLSPKHRRPPSLFYPVH